MDHYRDIFALNQMGIPVASLPEEGFELITERDDFIYESINGYLMFKVFKKTIWIWKSNCPLRKIADKKTKTMGIIEALVSRSSHLQPEILIRRYFYFLCQHER